ncbi:MAG: hypothetical protein AB1716_23525, partial [Planctomycetota bacterium]
APPDGFEFRVSSFKFQEAPLEARNSKLETRNLPVPPHLYPCYVQLVQQEVAEELAADIVRQVAAGLPPDAANPVAVRAALREHIADLAPDPPPLGPGSRRVAFVGPSGGGKTATVAKLAARLHLREQQSVALLSLEAQQPAGAAQLRHYSEIIGVPFCAACTVTEVKEWLAARREVSSFQFPVSSSAELETRNSKLETRNPKPEARNSKLETRNSKLETRNSKLETRNSSEVVLIDTLGVGLREQGRFARLASLLRAARPDEIHLVLPASLAPEVQQRIAASFAPLGLAGLVLTRLDDAIGFGVVLNALTRLNLPISYVSTGRTVPDDLETACGRRLAEVLLPADV